MTATAEHFACDQSNTRITLREDLKVIRRRDRSGGFVMLEDPVGLLFYRLGTFEHAFAILLDGQRTVAEAFQEHCHRTPASRLTENEAVELCRWLVSNRLAGTESSSPEPLNRGSDRSDWRKRWTQLSKTVCVRIPLARPDRWIAALNRRIGWLFGPWATAVGMIVMLYAMFAAMTHASALMDASRQSFAPQTLVAVLLFAAVLKVLHEAGHAVVCKRYGSEVGDFGVFLILGIPLPYVNVNSAWRIDSRFKRAHVAAAGIYTELLIAALAMIVWQYADGPAAKYVSFQVMLAASLSTLLCNANPLMKFDGYFILTDLARMPNLYLDAQRHCKRIADRLFFGSPSCDPDWTLGYRTFVTVYGVLALAWRLFVCGALVIAATGLFGGLGILLAAIATVTWFGVPLASLYRRMANTTAKQKRRFAVRAVSLATCVSLLLISLPAPGSGSAAAVVDYSPSAVVRAEVNGFVRQINVVSGQNVKQDDVLLVLENRSLIHDMQNAAWKVEASELRIRQHTIAGDHASAQAEASRLHAIRNEHRDLKDQVKQLVVRAPQPGRVLRRGLDQLIGTYLKIGDEILVIGNEDHKELRVMIPQQDFSTFGEQVGCPIEFQINNSEVRQGTLTKIDPQAKRQTRYRCLLADNGGPLPSVSDAKGGDGSFDSELLTPYFEAVVTLEASDGNTLKSGQRGTVTLRGGASSIGDLWWRQVDEKLLRWW